MRVKTSELKKGYIVKENIMGLTKYPIVPKNKVITDEVISVLKAFSIDEIEVEMALPAQKEDSSGKFDSNNLIKPFVQSKGKNLSKFQTLYSQAVKVYKKEFTRWQAGTSIDINVIRNALLPLFEELLERPTNLLFIQNFVEKEDYIVHHAIGVGLLSGYLAKKLKCNRADCNQILLGGALADSGLAKINPSFLKKDHLTKLEFEEIKMHTTYSYKMIKDIPSLKPSIKVAVLQHHERLDGSGYPFAEKANRIHFFAKIIAIADVYHAVVSERIYKERVTPFRALEILNHDEFGQFDVSILKVLTSSIVQLSLNTFVKLSNNQVGKIVYIDKANPTRPVIKLSEGKEIILLNHHKELFIKDILMNEVH